MGNQQLYKIYYLRCPISNEVRYVDISNNPNRRFREHCSYLTEVNRKTTWIKELKIQKLKPILEIVYESSSKKDPSEKEVYHISLFKNLLNSQKGGYNIKPKNSKPIKNEEVHEICKLIVLEKHDIFPHISKSSISAIRGKRLYVNISDLYFSVPVKSSHKRRNYILTSNAKINIETLKNICENFMLFNSPVEISKKYGISLRIVQTIYSKQNYKNLTENYIFPNIYGNKILFKFFIIKQLIDTQEVNSLFRKINYKNKGDLYKVFEKTLWRDVWEYFISSTTIEKERINLLLSRVSDKCWVTETGDVNLFYEDIV